MLFPVVYCIILFIVFPVYYILLGWELINTMSWLVSLQGGSQWQVNYPGCFVWDVTWYSGYYLIYYIDCVLFMVSWYFCNVYFLHLLIWNYSEGNIYQTVCLYSTAYIQYTCNLTLYWLCKLIDLLKHFLCHSDWLTFN